MRFMVMTDANRLTVKIQWSQSINHFQPPSKLRIVSSLSASRLRLTRRCEFFYRRNEKCFWALSQRCAFGEREPWVKERFSDFSLSYEIFPSVTSCDKVSCVEHYFMSAWSVCFSRAQTHLAHCRMIVGAQNSVHDHLRDTSLTSPPSMTLLLFFCRWLR